jgi:DNA repair exonuclease SbcCD ATPase subunit
MTKMVIGNAAGGAHPNPGYFGLEWSEVEGLFAEHEEIANRARTVKAKLDDLEGKLKAEEAALPRRRAEAAREGKSVDTKPLDKLRKQIEEIRTEHADIKAAAALVEKDVQAALRANRKKYLEQIEQKRREAAGRVHRIRQELAAEEWWFTATERLQGYLTREFLSGGYRFMGVGARPEKPSDVRPDA